MKNMGNGIFTDQLNENTSITIDCNKNKATVKNTKDEITYNVLFVDEITIDDYSKLRQKVESKL